MVKVLLVLQRHSNQWAVIVASINHSPFLINPLKNPPKLQVIFQKSMN